LPNAATDSRSGSARSDERFGMRGRSFADSPEAKPFIESSRFRRIRSKPDQCEGRARAFQKLLHQRSPYPAMTVCLPDIQVPEPADVMPIGVRIAVEAAYADKLAGPKGAEQPFAGPGKSVRSGMPVGDQPLHEAKAFGQGFLRQRRQAGMTTVDGLNTK